jgi:ATP synthase protein I
MAAPPPPGPPRRRTQFQFAMAMELPFIFVGAIVFGGLLGWWLDAKLGTSPWLMLLLGALGFWAGLREIQRQLARLRKQNDRDRSE